MYVCVSESDWPSWRNALKMASGHLLSLALSPGVVFGGCGGSCWNERGQPGCQRPSCHQLPGLPAQEELAEHQGTLYKEHHGKSSPVVLTINFFFPPFFIKNDLLSALVILCMFSFELCQFPNMRGRVVWLRLIVESC